MVDAITQLDVNGTGVELRTVQLWFQENDKGISAENIRLLARIFGCDDPDATVTWQAELIAAHRLLVSKRRAKKQSRADKTAPLVEADVSRRTRRSSHGSRGHSKGFSLALAAHALFSGKATLNLTAFVWAGCVLLGMIAYIFGVHSVTYSPIEGLDKQVGFIWAPNWTLLKLVVLPLFLATVVQVLGYWRVQRNTLAGMDSNRLHERVSWDEQLETYAFSHWAVLIVCFAFVFLVQWSGVHLSALLSGDAGNLMMDWNLVAIVRPDVISIGQAKLLSSLAFFYTATICYLFLTGLVLLQVVAQDFHELRLALVESPSADCQQHILETGKAIITSTFRCAVLGILIATCIKLQATYLVSDSENILMWLYKDLLAVLGLIEDGPGRLDQRALAHFTSFLLLFATCTVFFFSFVKIFQALAQLPRTGVSHAMSWLSMVGVILLLIISFLLIGQFSGFSLLLFLGLVLAVFGLCDPLFCHKAMNLSKSLER